MNNLILNDLNILGAVVPSYKELKDLPQSVLYQCEGPFWLRDTDKHMYVSENGRIYDSSLDSTLFIVPELICEKEIPEEISFIKIGDYPSIVENNHRILFKYAIDDNPYTYTENNYQDSYIKKVLDDWFDDFIIRYGDMEISIA